MRVTSDRREKKPLPCGTAQDISHLRLRYPLGTWNTRVFRRFGRIRELPLLSASRLQGQDPPSLGWTYYDSLGPASDEPADDEVRRGRRNENTRRGVGRRREIEEERRRGRGEGEESLRGEDERRSGGEVKRARGRGEVEWRR